MAHPSNTTISLKQLISAARNHRRLGAIVFVTVFALAIALWLVLPQKFGSGGKLFVRVGRANLAMNAAGDGSPNVSIQDTRETEIRSVAELIGSYDLLGAVVDEIGPERFIQYHFPFSINSELFGWNSSKASSDGFNEDRIPDKEFQRLTLREKAIAQLEKNLSVSSEKKTSVISIYCLASSPKMARDIVERLMGKVREKHLAIHSAGRSRDFFDREYEQQRIELVQAEKRLADFRNECGFLSVEQARNTLGGVIEKLENQRVDIQIELETSLARIGELTAQADAVSMELNMPTSGLESLSTEGAQTRLYERIAERSRLNARYNSGHPKLAEIEVEISNLEAEIAALPGERQQFAKVQNPVYEQLKVALALEKSNAKSLETRLAQVELKFVESQVRLKEFNHLELTDAERKRDVEVASQYFAVYARKRGDAKVSDQLDKQSISDVVVAQPASLILKKQSPKGSIILPLGLFLAICSALFATLFADRKNLTGMYSPNEIEDVLDLPVLATIPRIHASRVHSS